MKFKTWQDMYECLKKGQDLYNPQIQEYVFLYNEDGALCQYTIGTEEAMELSNISIENRLESWSTLLGIGGYILDNDNCDRINQYDDYIAPTYEYCRQFYNIDGWCDIAQYI